MIQIRDSNGYLVEYDSLEHYKASLRGELFTMSDCVQHDCQIEYDKKLHDKEEPAVRL
ncbi:MAG: hypothetical protein HUK20_14935 [Fibrobacter sp.]|nr:hypothetical protein [Fibrobacter sp.]